ncbi:transmembrane protease serine 9-like [Penaeus chinensis]|uniref:transmembrane protease serine 9-like n=1 Tax=Penaeus chinensis TaxID=139456 RepID=UPI001FB6B075|nr:transmembrane protease serine 9-like [Penaeus chinensis]
MLWLRERPMLLSVQRIPASTNMRSLLLLAAVAFQAVLASPMGAPLLPETRAALLCGNYSINANQSLFIKSRRFAQEYPKNHDCSYTFHCTDYAASLLLNCSRFELQGGDCTNDFMHVYDENSVDDTYCGTDGPQNVVTGDNFLGVRFKTNGDSVRKSGFFCKVRCYHVADKTTTTAASTTSTSTTTTQAPPTTTTTTPAPAPTPSNAYSGCRCGVARRSSRIVGGAETEVGEYPWQVGLYTTRLQTPYCGGSLVNNLYVVTAADCVDDVADFQIILGEHDYTKVSRVYVRTPDQVSIHPNYNALTKDNNIAVVRLSSPINLNADIPVKPVCLPDPSADFSGRTAVATGWGLMAEGGLESPVLREVELTVLSEADCPAGSSSTLCAGEPEGGKGTCNGDFGGPLVVDVDGQYVLAGVTSHGTGCARAGQPGVFTDVTSFLDWMLPIIESDGKSCGDNSATTTTSTQATTSTTQATTSNTQATTSTTQATTSATAAATSTNTAAASTTTTTDQASTTTTTVATTAPATANPTLLCSCGLPPNPLRAAGTDHINNNPWTVAILSKSSGQQLCSGAVINTYNVLTAIDCATGSVADLQVKANAQDLTSEVTRVVNRDVASVASSGDLAILKLTSPLSLTNWDGIKPACMPAYNPDFTGSPAVQSGYGRLSASAADSAQLKKVDGAFIWCSGLASDRVCFQPFQEQGFCGADKGGPIVAETNGRQYLAGIALKDNGCTTSSGMLFQEAARVASYYQWIMNTSQDGRFCGL